MSQAKKMHPTPPATLRDHIERTMRLAAPVILTRCGLLIMATVDTIMTGQASGLELAYLAIAFAPQITLLVIGFGFLAGTVILVSQTDGAGMKRDCGQIFWIGMANGAFLGILWAIVLFRGDLILQLFNQEADLVVHGGEVMRMFSWGIPGIFLFTACSMFLEGIGRPVPGLIVTIAANVVNAALNWVFVFGELGFDGMGASGAVLGTSITRWLMFAGIFAYVLTMADRHVYGILLPIRNAMALERRFLRLGMPMALTYAFETSAFMVITMMAGHLGNVSVAAFQAAMNVNAFCFMIAIGMSTATAVRVGNAVGRRDRRGVELAGWVGTGLILLLMLPFAVIIWLIPESLASIYTNSEEISALIVAALFVVVVLVPSDGLHAVLTGALRGAADVWPATWIGLFSFWAVMVPASWMFGHYLGWGVEGLMWGETFGITLAGILLAWRFRVISKREVRVYR